MKIMIDKKILKNYNPYVYLVMDNDYEEDVINYYNRYKEIYGDSDRFNKRVVKANDEAIDMIVEEFLSNRDDSKKALNKLKEEVRKIKNIILITEDGSKTKKHICMIDSKVNKAINDKSQCLGLEDEERYKSFIMFDEFYEDYDYDRAVLRLKNGVNNLISEYEGNYSVDKANEIKKKIINEMNEIIDDRAKQTYVYQLYDVQIKYLINKYKDMVVNTNEDYLVWVSNLKNDYQQLKLKLKDIYPNNVYKKIIKLYDKLVDDLIDDVMGKNCSLKLYDNQELDSLFSYYKKNIDDYQFDEYYKYMTDSEKFNVKREMYEEKNRVFKRNIRNFNKMIRNKYSSNYANAYVDKVNKRADTIIKKNAKHVGMPVPKNPWIVRKYLWADTENFVSETGIKLRKYINPILRKIVRLAMENKLIIEEMPKLDKNKQYIFVSTHYFTEDVIGLFTATDRQAHMLMGTTDQIENNPLMLAAMAFGFFHVDRLDKEDRKECFEKQNILIEKGTSFINYIGGGWENSENELQPPSFSGVYRTSKLKDVLIVPVASYLVREDKRVYMRFGEPLDVRKCDENTANDIIRDTLASMHYKQISKYSYPITDSKLVINNKVVSTHKLPYDQHKYYMDQIGDEYWHQPWTKPFAKEEIGPRRRKITTLEEVYGFIDNLSREKLIELSSMLSSEMVKIDEKERYNISKYLDANYVKFKVRSLKKK